MNNRLLFALLSLVFGAGTRVWAQGRPFATGADVGWLTEMEAAGRVFYNSAGTPQDLLQILRDYDMNTIRLRVWVNPAGGWNGKNDASSNTSLFYCRPPQLDGDAPVAHYPFICL